MRRALAVAVLLALVGGACADDKRNDLDLSWDAAIEATPSSSIVNQRLQPWDHIERRDGGRTLRVYYYGGVGECGQLARVDTRREGKVVAVTLHVGTRGAPTDCTLAGLPYYTDVVLDRPVPKGATFTGKADA